MSGLAEKSPNIAEIEERLRSIRPDPGERFHQRMAGAPWQVLHHNRRGIVPMNPKMRLAIFVMLMVLLMAALAALPAGRVLANEVLHFFTRNPANSMPLPPDQIMAPVPSATPEPTHALTLQPADQAAQVTATATLAPTPGSNPAEMKEMSLVEAEAAVGFDLYQPLNLPRDYRLKRIFYDAEHQAANLWYASPQASTGEFFQITEGKALAPLSVGADATVETVAVGEYRAEFVRGMWFTADGASQKTWVNDAEVYTIRWQAGDITISILFMLNDRFYPAYLERNEMLAVARGMARCAPGGDHVCLVAQPTQAKTPEPADPWADALNSVAEAQTKAAFDLLEPAILPEGLSFSHARYSSFSGSIMLFYGSFGPDKIRMTGPVLIIDEMPRSVTMSSPADTYPPEAIQAVEVNGYRGYLVTGDMSTGVFEPGQPTATPAWDADTGSVWLTWETADMHITIQFHPGRQGARLSAQDMLKIGESLK